MKLTFEQATERKQELTAKANTAHSNLKLIRQALTQQAADAGKIKRSALNDGEGLPPPVVANNPLYKAARAEVTAATQALSEFNTAYVLKFQRRLREEARLDAARYGVPSVFIPDRLRFCSYDKPNLG
jgi:hypothetical protein